MERRADADNGEFRDLVLQLIDALRLHRAHHRSLAEVLRDKKKAMIAIDTLRLEQVLDVEREVIGAIGAIDEERIHLTREIAECLGKPRGETLRLAELVTRVSDELAEELLDLREDLRDVADELEQLNQHSRTLVVQSLEHVNLYLALLASKDEEAETYTHRSAERDDGPESILLDRRI